MSAKGKFLQRLAEMRNSFACAAALTAVLLCAEPSYAGNGPFSEVRLGVLAHDPFTHKEDGVDINASVYFHNFDWFDGAWDIRPSLGVSVNTGGDTSLIYADLNFGGPIGRSTFAEIGAGVAAHDGETETQDPNRKEFGSTVLFHLSASVGVMLTDGMSASVYIDHISNAGLAEHNEGLETAGLRLGFGL